MRFLSRAFLAFFFGFGLPRFFGGGGVPRRALSAFSKPPGRGGTVVSFCLRFAIAAGGLYLCQQAFPRRVREQGSVLLHLGNKQLHKV